MLTMLQSGKEGFELLKVLECILEDWGEGVLCVCVHVPAVAKALPFPFPHGMELTAAMHE